MIHCVWCGQSDEGQHLSINLAGKGFRCWRQPIHSGKNPAKLIQALLNCSWEQAAILAGQAKPLPGDFINRVKSSLTKQEVIQPLPNKLRPPVEFRSFSNFTNTSTHRPYLDYINDRGFQIEDAIEYDIHYALRGLYKGRIIFLIKYKKELVGWTGRTVFQTEQIRYKTLSHDIEKARERGEIPAINPISHYLLFYDRLLETDADTLILCEGPFDAWKINILGKTIGVVATCFFTSTLSQQQLNLLHEIMPLYTNRFLLLDKNTFSTAARIKSLLVTLSIVVKQLPDNVKDPGEIKSTKQLKEMLAIV